MLESKKSPLVSKKVINSSLQQKEKPFASVQSGALTYQINKHYNQNIKSTSGPKILSTSRNNYHQQSIEDSQYFQTKTISINLNQLAHSSSQSSLKSALYKTKTVKGDANDKGSIKRVQGSFTQINRVQTARSRKSPSPQKILYNLDAKKQYQSIAYDNLNSSKSLIQKNKKSIDSMLSNSRLSNKFVTSKKEISNQQQVFRTTVSAVTSANNLKSRASDANQTKITLSSYRPSFAQQTNFGLGSFETKKLIKNPVNVTGEKQRRTKRTSDNLMSPCIMTQQSPRLTLGAGSTAGATSVYSVTTESIVNSSAYHVTNNRKMCLSEKLAPKGKKKRTNAQKQPKQITITRDQIILQPFLSLYSTQNGIINTQGDKFVTNPDAQNQSNESSLQIQMIESKNDLETTPVTNYNDLGDDQEFMKQFQRDMSSKDLQTVPRGASGCFSFQLLNATQMHGKHSVLEESKEETGIFGGQLLDTLGNEHHSRPSFDIIGDKKQNNEVPTPVFQTTNRSQSSFRPSDIILHLDVKLCDDSPKQRIILNEDKLQPSHQQRIFEMKTEQDQEFHSELSNTLHHDKSMKKVYSTSDLSMSRGNISNQTSIRQRNDSNGSFFSRIKNYFGAKPHSEIIDFQGLDVEYRCKCGPSGKPYACKRALKWLSHANNYSEMEYEKNKQLYQGLLKFNTASGSETQIERDIPRTFPNTDPYMNTNEGQQKLSRVLNAFSKYFTSIGYVQGMNFIVGALLMHCSEDIAFWLFVSLIEDFEMRDIYQPKLPGLYKHSQVLQLLQMEHLERLYYHFSVQNILIEMYASDWVFALFSNIIPISEYHHFLDQFFIGGWTFFYKFSLTFLKCHQEEVLELYDLSEILNMIKLKNIKKDNIQDNKSPRIRFDESGQISELESMKRYSDTSSISPTRQTGQMSQMKNLFKKFVLGKDQIITSESFKDDAVWERLVALSCREWEIEFNENFVNQLLSSFDPEKLVFNQSFPTTPQEVSIVYSARKQSRADICGELSPEQSLNKRKIQLEKTKVIQQKKEAKLQIIVTENGIRNHPRQNKLFFIDSSRSSVKSKQAKSQQPRDFKLKSTTKRQAP